VSRKESPGVVSFWNQTPLAACCGAGFDPKASLKRALRANQETDEGKLRCPGELLDNENPIQGHRA
jgi:hypothetical protein